MVAKFAEGKYCSSIDKVALCVVLLPCGLWVGGIHIWCFLFLFVDVVGV